MNAATDLISKQKKAGSDEFKIARQAEAAFDLVNIIKGSGEDDPDLVADTIEGETSLFEVINSALDEIDHLDAIEAGCKQKATQFSDRAKKAKSRSERIKAAIEQAMVRTDQKTLRLVSATLTLRDTPPSVTIDDEALIPAEYWIPQPPTLDKKKINEAAKTSTIAGTGKSNGSVSLSIRRL